MPYRITWESEGVYSKFWGEVNVVQVLAMLEEVGGDYRFDEIFYLLADYTEVTTPQVTPSDVDLVAAIDRAQMLSNQHYLHAAVAESEEALVLLRYWVSLYQDPRHASYFTSVAEARAWVETRKCRKVRASRKPVNGD